MSSRVVPSSAFGKMIVEHLPKLFAECAELLDRLDRPIHGCIRRFRPMHRFPSATKRAISLSGVDRAEMD
jgi:hypothetical protein